INVTVTTGSNGKFTFNSVPNGTYHLTLGTQTSYLPGGSSIDSISSPPGVTLLSPVVVSGGHSITNGSVTFQGLDPTVISPRDFLASGGGITFPTAGTAGSGK